MRTSDLKHLTELIQLASEGRLSRSDVVALFMYVRGDAPARSMLKDIGHTIAHDERDRGWAYDYLTAFAASFVDFLNGSGERMTVGVLFEVHAVIDEVADMMDGLGVPCDRAGLHSESDGLVRLLADVLDGTKILLKRADIEVEFSNQPRSVVITFPNGMPGTSEGGKPYKPDLRHAFPLLVDPRYRPAK